MLLLLVLVTGGSAAVIKAASAYTGLGGPIARTVRVAFDWDRDGYSRFLGGGDCDDGDPTVHPGAPEQPGDGVDQNCVGGDPDPKRGASDVGFAPVPAGVPTDFNVILITIDTTRADHLGAYGYSRPTSPNLDALAAAGTVFEDSWAHAPSTRYSIPAILTGQNTKKYDIHFKFASMHLSGQGKPVVGNYSLSIGGARGGEVIDFVYTEVVDPQTLKPELRFPDGSSVAFSGRITCRAGRTEHMFYHPYGFRHVTITVRNTTVPLHISPCLRRTGYPLERRGSFQSSEPLLEQIWETCAWSQQNCMLDAYVDTPWRDLPKKDRDWILFTDEQPTVPVYAGYTPAETRRALKRKEEPSYQGTFTGARKYVLQTFATTQSAMMKRRVQQFMLGSECPVCHGKRLRPESLSVKFAGLDIAALGIPTLDEMLTRYLAATGDSLGAPLEWYLAYNLFRFAAILHGVAARGRAGNANNARAALAQQRVGPLAETAWRFAQKVPA